MSIEMPTTVNGFMEYYRVPSWLERYANETFKSLSVVEQVYVLSVHNKKLGD